MKLEKRRADDERTIAIGMITDKIVLARIASCWPGAGADPLFSNKWVNLVGSWCVKHYRDFKEAPGSAIVKIHERWAGSKQRDKSVAEMVESFLELLNGEYEKRDGALSSDFLIDLAVRRFNFVRLKRNAENTLTDLDTGDLDAALTRESKSRIIQLGDEEGVDIFDRDIIMSAFAELNESLIQFPGARGRFFGDSLGRDALFTWIAPEKRGKTYALIDAGWYGMSQRKRVAFFGCGDMTRSQMMRRFIVRAAKRPIRAGRLKLAKSITREAGQTMAQIEWDRKTFDSDLDWNDAKEFFEAVRLRHVKSYNPYFYLHCYPAGTANIATIQAALERKAQTGWVPDIIIIDYADILASQPGMGKYDKRDQINETWIALRALSQSMRCLVMTATQADAMSYGAHTITQKNFSNDKRIWAHVTGAVGINQTETEHPRRIARLGWIHRREGEKTAQCHIATAYSICNFALRSCF